MGGISYAYLASKTIRLAAYTGFGGEQVHSFKSGAVVPAFTLFYKSGDRNKLQQWMVDARASWDDSFALTLMHVDTRRIYHEIAPIYARSELSILLLGETGTGKDSLAKHIHETSGRQGDYVPINCSGLEASLAFNELFGYTAERSDVQYHELGIILQASGYQAGRRLTGKNSQAFLDWLREANPDPEEQNGLFQSWTAEQFTLFLDEVATLPPKVMAGILRVLSTGKVRHSVIMVLVSPVTAESLPQPMR
ncbi:MAG TPA: sigma 54-interacting transcriptional regulator [Pyrinomonadaceae bacterium]|nr:sigma 54-interacting transcriptional regulator [Pyrinomonadaceae bacterium]